MNIPEKLATLVLGGVRDDLIMRILSKDEPLCSDRPDRHLGDVAAFLLGSRQHTGEIKAILGYPTIGYPTLNDFHIPYPIVADWIDRVRQRSAVLQAGAGMISINTDRAHIAKSNQNLVWSWDKNRPEVKDIGPTFSRMTLQPRMGTIILNAPSDLFENSINGSDVALEYLVKAGAAFIDRYALSGTGIAPEPCGILNQSGVQEMPEVGELNSCGPLIDANCLLDVANAGPVSAILMHPREKFGLDILTDTLNRPLKQPPCMSIIPKFTTTYLDEGSAILGNFEQALLGISMDVSIERLYKPFEIILLVNFKWDFAVTNPKSFVVLRGITPSSK